MTRTHVLLTALLAALGLATGLVVFTPAANAWDWQNLPTGYSPSIVIYHTSGGDTCRQLTINGTYIGDTCNDPDFQQKVDAYIDSTICTVNPGAGGNACITTSATTANTTTDTTTTTTDPTSTDTTTTPPSTVPAGTDTTATTPAGPSLQEQVTSLQQQLAQLATRVGALEQANTAAWDAFSATLAAGGTTAQAALAARSAGLNAIYELS